jgi:tryptophanyl-tRNA synthetase
VAADTNAKRKRVLSGMRPTGRLQIGNYFGALQNWVKLQNATTAQGEKEYECFYFIADWHALTSDYADTSALAENALQVTIDFLAAGLDPQKSVIFQQSFVPEHAELHLLLSMLTPLGWLERVPTYKEALENIKDKDLHNYGFLGYPVLQTADIVIYSEPGAPLVVPVGEDQVSHVEISREIVRRFDSFYGLEIDRSLFEVNCRPALRYLGDEFFGDAFNLKGYGEKPLGTEAQQVLESRFRGAAAQMGCVNFLERSERTLRTARIDYRFFRAREVLSEPQVMLTQTPRIPGLDGRKMSKSYGNAITLSESDADIRAKTKVMVTDPARKRRTDPGNPDVCPVYDWHKLFSPRETLEWAAQGCRTAGIGCIECKAKMADHLITWIAPIRERRFEYEQHPARVLEIIDAGSKSARRHAQETMVRVREAVFGWDKKRKELASGEGTNGDTVQN